MGSGGGILAVEQRGLPPICRSGLSLFLYASATTLGDTASCCFVHGLCGRLPSVSAAVFATGCSKGKISKKPSSCPSCCARPLFCMGFFYATRRRKITSISVTAGIVLLIVLVRLLPQPWRGIIDLSVVVGLGWGIVSLVFFAYRAFSSEQFDYPPDVPEDK